MGALPNVDFNHIIQLLEVIIAILGLYITITQIIRKQLSYTVIQDNSSSKSNPFPIELKIWNSGNRNLSKNDFQDPLVVKFDSTIEVLKIDVDCPSHGIPLTIYSHPPNVITVEAFPLNKREFIILKILADLHGHSYRDPSIIGHFSDETRLTRRDGDTKGIIFTLLACSILVLSALIFFSELLLLEYSDSLFDWYILLTSGVLMLASLLIALLLSRQK